MVVTREVRFETADSRTRRNVGVEVRTRLFVRWAAGESEVSLTFFLLPIGVNNEFQSKQ